MQGVIEEIDCSRFSSERGSAECEEQGNAGIGVLTIIVFLVLVTGCIFWRRVVRNYETTSQDTASPTDAEKEAARRRLQEEYQAKLDSRDADTLEASRDWHDNFGSSWRMEAGLALGLLVLFGSLLVLIPLLLLFKSLAE
jgi:flagellar biosynthesis/type III secretory pathway M-ring protein FliF/YscJ